MTACAAPATIASPTRFSARFRALCETHGFAENFDALTGTGLRDHASTPTVGSYLLLADAHTPGQPLTDRLTQALRRRSSSSPSPLTLLGVAQ